MAANHRQESSASSPVKRRPAVAATKKQRLQELEAIIKPGLASFVAVGRALAEIKRDRLYLATHHSFEDYCREKWNLSTSHAYRQIEGAALHEELAPLGVTLRNEHAARTAKKYKTAIKARVQQGEDPDEVLLGYVEQDGARGRASEQHSNKTSPIGDTEPERHEGIRSRRGQRPPSPAPNPIDQLLERFRHHVLPMIEGLDDGDRTKAIELLRGELDGL